MGFFDGISKFIAGGSDSSSSGGSASGFALLPPELQSAFKSYASQLTNQFSSPGAANDLFTPLPQTGFETTALNRISDGLAPTSESLRSDIAMQMNPFDEFVINDINRQADGQFSILKRAMGEAGQLGSNRKMLGANDIEQTRLNTVGKFRQDQYNTALDNSLNELAGLRQGDIANNFTAGGFLRGLDTQTKQAPINALTSFGQLLGAIPQTGGSTASNESSSSSQNGFDDTLSGLAKAGGFAALFSDRRLKENVVKVGREKGHDIYEFSYLGDDTRYRGVMAQDVMQTNPEAVVEDADTGFLKVDYGAIGLTMQEVKPWLS